MMPSWIRNKWIKTTLVSIFGGGIAGSVAALSDPAKYRFPQDLGTGKMWPFFLSGAGMTLGAMLLKSPLGQQVVGALKDSQQQLAEGKQAVEDAKADVKAGVTPAPGPGGKKQ